MPPTKEAPPEVTWHELAALPVGRSNNAVAALAGTDGPTLVSFLGIGAGKDHEAIARDAFRLSPGAGATWQSLAPPPHPSGRLASIALTVGDYVYVIGGYTVDPDGHEVSVPDVDRFDATTNSYESQPPMPIAVDDAVAGVWRDRYIVLVSGWSNTTNVSDVQLFDTANNDWIAGTPIIGAPVFGHGGAVSGDTIVYCGGAAIDPEKNPKYVAYDGCFSGELDESRPGTIAWRSIAHHTGPPRYRMACGATGDFVVCAGGTDNPYNYNGIGYDKQPAVPIAEVVAYDVTRERWYDLGAAPVATMDHRSLAVVGDDLFLIGGMEAQQLVTRRNWRLHVSY